MVCRHVALRTRGGMLLVGCVVFGVVASSGNGVFETSLVGLANRVSNLINKS